jgi:hypothetical protein
MRLRRCALAVVAVTSLVALSACGSSDDPSNADSSSPATGSTSGTDTGSTGSGSSGSGGSNVDVLTAKTLGVAMARAVADAGSAHMVMVSQSTAGKVSMTGDVAGLGEKLEAVEMGMRINLPGVGSAQMRIVDSAMYLKVPNLGVGSKSWIKIPLDDPNNPLGSVYSQLAALTDPDAIRASFSAFSKFTDLGTETVDGVQARHYRVTVDTAKSLKASGLDQIGGLPTRELLKSMPKETTSELWVDGDNRLVKMSSDASTVASYEIHYSKWGAPVQVSAPPPGQVQQMPAL